MSLIETLNWRYAAKRMNEKKIPAVQADQIIEAIRLSASSAGLQPYKVIVVKNDELKKQLQQSSFNPQVSECSHLLVFAAYESVTQKHIDEYINLIAATRNVTTESLADFSTRLSANFSKLSAQESFHWASRQAYIALGTALIAAADLKIDASPMEGFHAAQFDKILGLDEKGLRSVVILGLGYRDEKADFLVNAKKVRKPMNKLVLVFE